MGNEAQTCCYRVLHVPREPGGNWHLTTSISAGPVVVASSGPCPSATLHEDRVTLIKSRDSQSINSTYIQCQGEDLRGSSGRPGCILPLSWPPLSTHVM